MPIDFLTSGEYMAQVTTPTFLPSRIDRRAFVGRLLAVEQHAEDLEALLALQPVVLLGAAEAGLAGADGEVEAELPQRVAGAFVRRTGYFCELS